MKANISSKTGVLHNKSESELSIYTVKQFTTIVPNFHGTTNLIRQKSFLKYIPH